MADDGGVGFSGAVPVVRIFDEAEARGFYVDHLGMTVDFEHRFEDGLPIYLQVSRGDLVLHLSEHHGDGTPGTVVYVPVTDLAALVADLATRPHARLRIGPHVDELGGWLELPDPFGNVLRFHQPA